MNNPNRTSERYAIIMAGGRGERFWPLSRENTPKQLLKLLGDQSLLQQAVGRVLPLVPAAQIFVITNASQVPAVREQLPELPVDNIVAEPIGRDTCAAVALGAALVGARAPNGTMAVLPADHVISDDGRFQQVLSDAFGLAEERRAVVTLGIEPTEPATGYGYIRLGEKLPPAEASRACATVFHAAERFVEKPPYDTAVEYLASGNYRWNAGMFVWSVPTILESLSEHCADMAEVCRRWMAVAREPEALVQCLARDYPALPRISVDYALMEHATNVCVADAQFPWDDLGSWSALARHLEADAHGNCACADFMHVDGCDNLVYDARTTARTPIALVGLSNLIVVHTDDAVLVVEKTQAQKVKELVQQLAEDEVLRKLV